MKKVKSFFVKFWGGIKKPFGFINMSISISSNVLQLILRCSMMQNLIIQRLLLYEL